MELGGITAGIFASAPLRANPDVRFRTGAWAAHGACATLQAVNPKPPSAPPSGAAMDRPRPTPPALPAWALWRRPVLRGLLAGLLLLGGAALTLRQALPGTPRLSASAQLATVVAGEFRDELPLRARSEPLRAVQLSAQEAGRVESVFVQEGDWVREGMPLLRLHSPEQEQQLLQRGAEVAQQLANVALQRTAMTASLAAARRELAQLRAAEQQADSEWQRQAGLAAAGFVSAAALEDRTRQLQLARQLRSQAEQDLQQDSSVRQQSLNEMDRAVQGLQHGLQLLERARERLLLRAPLSGRLSGFTPELGASLRAGEPLGRIDDPEAGAQLLAEVDEFYLPRLRSGLPAHSPHGPLRLSQTLPQVRDGKVRVQLHWAGTAPAGLRPGQAVDLRLQLSPPGPALLLPEGPGVQPRLFVREGSRLRARPVRLGRRAAGQVEVLAGLQAGDQVLISLPSQPEAETLLLP